MEKDILVRMQEDLARALAKPAGERRWAMLVDLRRCTGCRACTVGCVSENKLPPQLWYRPVHDYEQGKYPDVSRTWLPRPCMQCDKPPCVAACPVKGPQGATWKESQGIGAGIVPINYEKCIGCEQCIPACPYGARTMDAGKFHSEGTPELMRYETMASFEYGKQWLRGGNNPPIGKARKCHFCLHRLAAGQIPTCISTCVCRAGYFGDESDPQSLIAEVKKANKVQVLKPGKGTKPRVYYIAQEKLEVLYGK
jgi:molybdopterin-containing oxidoreductase family iron-sulfur binding subunit